MNGGKITHTHTLYKGITLRKENIMKSFNEWMEEMSQMQREGHYPERRKSWRYALEKEVESDFRRKAITLGERDDLLKLIQNSDSETEARKVVDSHRRGRA